MWKRCGGKQVKRWKQAGGAPCDVMVDTGMNRLGLAVQDVTDGLLDGLNIATLMSHLASADENVPQNERQRRAFAALAGRTGARRMSLANSAGICLGPDYHFDLTRPGLALYGGVPRGEAAGHIAQVAHPEAQVIQRRRIGAVLLAHAALELFDGYGDSRRRSRRHCRLRQPPRQRDC